MLLLFSSGESKHSGFNTGVGKLTTRSLEWANTRLTHLGKTLMTSPCDTRARFLMPILFTWFGYTILASGYLKITYACSHFKKKVEGAPSSRLVGPNWSQRGRGMLVRAERETWKNRLSPRHERFWRPAGRPFNIFLKVTAGIGPTRRSQCSHNGLQGGYRAHAWQRVVTIAPNQGREQKKHKTGWTLKRFYHKRSKKVQFSKIL